MNGIVARKRMSLVGWILAASLFWLAAPRSAAAQTTPAPASAVPAASIEIGALVDGYYDYYSTKPVGDAPYRNFDTLHNQFALSMAELWLARAPTADSRVGFKLKLNFGAASTNFIHSAEAAAYQNIQEAYGSYLAEVGKGLQIDFGVFVTPAGAEVIEAKDNMNYSRGLLFTNAIPYYHAGVRASYAASDKVTVMAAIVNGWNNVVENNSGKTVIGAVTVKPNSKASLVVNYITGPEEKGTEDNWKNLLDVIATYSVDDKTTVTANYDYGRESFAGSAAHWQGLAGYVKYQATKVIAVSPRFEFYNDANGFTTKVPQKLKELTGTIEVKASDNLIWRIEYRRDWSDKDVFKNSDNKLQGSQQSIGFGVLYSFTGSIQ